jgi:hypothetical protein
MESGAARLLMVMPGRPYSPTGRLAVRPQMAAGCGR